MSQAPLLLELFTEELPPKALKRLGQSFSEGITQQLQLAGLLTEGSVSTSYATPRRLAVHITNVLAKAPNRSVQEKLLPVSIALDINGQATPPLLKKLASLGFPDARIEDLNRQGNDKSEAFYLTNGMKRMSKKSVLSRFENLMQQNAFFICRDTAKCPKTHARKKRFEAF